VPELRAVLDTAPLVAIATSSEQSLGPAAQRLVKRVARAGDLLGIPSVCLFEVAQLEERGRLKLRFPFEDWCRLLEESAGLRLLPLDLAVVCEARALPALRDPFDRLIAGTAVAHGVPLISPDRRVTGSGRLAVVW
jgi:PIN domain nuclease of toxin-antitoxin system